ncbi:MAG: bifunctional hydroxymethylpyrimidine kinase/phosphomethylpyrimidine kinase [Rhodothermia bacterium]|nr:bifunctional hydroxymethylpyrimidine kinase/phosphomethylpyrimidine kinase [Rhodothermia bacterium]NNE35101.1 bifunctional hydroxymethylpyrimidine kinase/phosphomethylpyrimidine kinase [Rhodothermales bacterium]
MLQRRATDTPVVLSIAGSDSGGGAGIQADIKSIQANGVFAATVITAVTAQNTREVTAAKDMPVNLVEAQFRAVWDDIRVDAIKTGMLSSSKIIEAVSRLLDKYRGDVPVVVDPVMISKSGFPLLKDDAVKTMIERLLPIATVVTPNAHEASRLADMEVKSVADAKEAAKKIRALGPANVLVKGGHLEDDDRAVDFLFDGESMHVFAVPRVDSDNTHGTGCTYASAIAANLAKGYPLVKSVERAKGYVTMAIENGIPIGSGHGPTGHFYYLRSFGRFPIEDV